MDGTVQVLLSGALTFGVPLAIAVRELIILKRRDGNGWDGDGHRPVAPKPLPPMDQKPLPACLIPVLPKGGVRVRELEDA